MTPGCAWSGPCMPLQPHLFFFPNLILTLSSIVYSPWRILASAGVWNTQALAHLGALSHALPSTKDSLRAFSLHTWSPLSFWPLLLCHLQEAFPFYSICNSFSCSRTLFVSFVDLITISTYFISLFVGLLGVCVCVCVCICSVPHSPASLERKLLKGRDHVSLFTVVSLGQDPSWTRYPIHREGREGGSLRKGGCFSRQPSFPWMWAVCPAQP